MPADGADGLQQGRAAEIQNLLAALEPLLLDFVDRADSASAGPAQSASDSQRNNALLNYLPPDRLQQSFKVALPDQGRGNEGVVAFVDAILKHSANTWHQGFMSKLYASTNAVGVASELLLAFLNTNVHTYSVSPALSAIEKTVAKALAGLFGFASDSAGGIVQPGGSGANLTALVTARNSLHPATKTLGVDGNQRLVLFTSKHGHYSFEKASIICGLGSAAVRPVDVDAKGRMSPDDLTRQIAAARDAGLTPFFVNATAGTTVLGSYDPLQEIGEICAREELWFHVDASWGGPAIFSEQHKLKLKGSDLADSLTVNPHKMMGVPVTCSFLLAKDLDRFWKSNTLRAPYLFHASEEEAKAGAKDPEGERGSAAENEVWDLADLTLQCGRRGDAVKLALSWEYYGRERIRQRVDDAFDVAAYLAALVASSDRLSLVSESPPPCLQVCFYALPSATADANSRATRRIAARLLAAKEFHVDYAPGDMGLFLRAVCSLETTRATAERLVQSVEELAKEE